MLKRGNRYIDNICSFMDYFTTIAPKIIKGYGESVFDDLFEYIQNSDAITSLNYDYDLFQETQGESADIWKHYRIEEKIPNRILLGFDDFKMSTADCEEKVRELFASFHFYDKNRECCLVPHMINPNQSLFMDAIWDKNKAYVSDFLRSVIARYLRALPLGTVEVMVFDPIGLGDNLGPLMNLADKDGSALCSYYVDGNSMYNAISDLFVHVTDVVKIYTSAGCNNIYEYNRGKSVNERIPRKLLVMFDFPKMMDSRTLEKLDTIMTKASDCGISILMSRGKNEEMDKHVQEFLDHNADLFETCEEQEDHFAYRNQEYENTFRYLKAPATQEFYKEMKSLYTYKPVSSTGFHSLFSIEALPEPMDCTEKLLLPYAVDEDGELVSLELNTSNCAHGFISGGTGSGKSSVLHMIIASAMMHYSPEDLELWLVDYKINEFSLYADHCPKHVRYVIYDKSEEISYDFVRQLNEELEYRQRLFKETGVSDYPTYIRQERYKNDSRNGVKLPRILVVIDETHNLSHVASEDFELKNTMNRLFAELRAYGVNLLLADQSARSGLGGFSPNAADQINTRVALRNSADEISTTLKINESSEELRRLVNSTADKNAAAGTLLFQNAYSQIVQLKSIFIDTKDKKTLPTLVNTVNSRYASFNRNHDFYYDCGRSYMDKKKVKDFEALYPCNKRTEGERFYLGTPLGIRYCFYMNINPDKVRGENILIAGSSQEMQYSLIEAIGASATRHGYQTTILGSVKSSLYAQYPELFEDRGNKKCITKIGELCNYIGEKAEIINKYLLEYDEEDEEDEEDIPTEKTFIVIPNMDEFFGRLEKCRFSNRKDALDEYNRRLREAQQNESDTESLSSETIEKSAPKTEERSMSDRISQLLNLGGELDDVLAQMNNKDPFGPETKAVKMPGYDATNDLITIIKEGNRFGIHVVCLMDSALVAKQKRTLFEENFNHRIVMPMGPDEASAVLSHTKVIAKLNAEDDKSQAVYEHNHGREEAFRPYLFGAETDK